MFHRVRRLWEEIEIARDCSRCFVGNRRVAHHGMDYCCGSRPDEEECAIALDGMLAVVEDVQRDVGLDEEGLS